MLIVISITISTAKILRFENGEERRCPQGSVLNVARRLNAAMKINFCVKRAQQNQRLILLLSLKIVHAARAEPHLKAVPVHGIVRRVDPNAKEFPAVSGINILRGANSAV